MKIRVIVFLSILFMCNYAFSLQLFLRKGIIISKAKIVNKMNIFPTEKNEIEVEAIFGTSQGRTKLLKKDIVEVVIEDEDIITPIIIEQKGKVSINRLFTAVKKSPIIQPYTKITTANNSYVTVGLNQTPAFVIYPNSKFYFDLNVSGMPEKYSLRAEEPMVEEEIYLKEEYHIQLLSGTLVGTDVNNSYKSEYIIHCPNNIMLKINSSIYYVTYKKNKFVIATLNGNIIIDEQNSTSTKSVSPEQFAVIDYSKTEYIVIKHIRKNKKIHELLKKVQSGEISHFDKSKIPEVTFVKAVKRETSEKKITKAKKDTKKNESMDEDEDEDDEDEDDE